MAEQDQEMDYFKEKLYSNFKEAGLLDHLKSQMRYNILEKLQKRTLSKDANKENINTINQKKESTLNFRLLISIISEFLEYYGYNYTQAVFLPEAKHTNQTLARNEIVDILHLTKIANKEDPSPLLNKIIDYVDRQLDATKERMSIQCQTDFEGRNTNLEDKLRNIDYEYLQKIDGERIATQQSFDEKFIKFKKDYEQRMKAEMTAEITRIKEFELANIRLDEAEKYRLKMEQYRDELDKVYTEKLQKLREREKDTIERCKQQLKALETASFDHRQKFLKDLEMHKMKEEGLDQHVNLEKENLRLQKQRLQELERDLQRQTQELEEQKRSMSLTRKHEEVKASFKPEASRDAEEDRIALMHTKARLETESNKTEQYKGAMENYETQNKRLLEENQQIMEEVRRLREIKKNLELDLEKTKETLQVMKKSLEKDEEHIKLYDKQIQGYQDEINSHKTAVAEYKDMLQQRKREQIEANQKFIKEIEFYQNEIEKSERERDALRRRIQELEIELNTMSQTYAQAQAQIHFHGQTVEMGTQKDSVRTTNRQMMPEPKRDSYRNTNYMPDSANRFRYSVIVEENEEPLRRLETIDREIRELKDKRENEILGYTTSSPEKKTYKAHSTSPRFERERFPIREEEVQQSPQFRPYIDQSGTNLLSLEKKKQDLKHELKHMIGLDDSLRHEYSRQADDSFAGSRPIRETQKDLFNFDNIFDKYADKMLEDSNRFDSPNKTPYQKVSKFSSEGGMKYEDMEFSGKKDEVVKKPQGFGSKGNEGSSRVQDIFKVPTSKPIPEPKFETKPQFDVLEELSQRSHKSLLDSFTEDNPQPIIFTKKETAPKKEPEKKVTSTQKGSSKPVEEVKLQPQPKKVEKLEPQSELPTSIGNKNLSRLDRPKLGDINPSQAKVAEKSAPLVLPGLSTKSKPKEEPKRNEPRANAAIDAILGDQRKVTDEIDFEEIDEELFDL